MSMCPIHMRPLYQSGPRTFSLGTKFSPPADFNKWLWVDFLELTTLVHEIVSGFDPRARLIFESMDFRPLRSDKVKPLLPSNPLRPVLLWHSAGGLNVTEYLTFEILVNATKERKGQNIYAPHQWAKKVISIAQKGGSELRRIETGTPILTTGYEMFHITLHTFVLVDLDIL